MSSPNQVPNIQGPRLPSEENRESEIDPEKFRRIIKVEETDDSQKKKKKQPAEEETEEEEAEAESAASAKAAASFAGFMSEDEKAESILDVGKTSNKIRRAPSMSADEETKMWEGPRSSYAGRIMGKDTGEEVGDALFEDLKAAPQEQKSPLMGGEEEGAATVAPISASSEEQEPSLDTLAEAPPPPSEEAQEAPPEEPSPQVAALPQAPPPPQRIPQIEDEETNVPQGGEEASPVSSSSQQGISSDESDEGARTQSTTTTASPFEKTTTKEKEEKILKEAQQVSIKEDKPIHAKEKEEDLSLSEKKPMLKGVDGMPQEETAPLPSPQEPSFHAAKPSKPDLVTQEPHKAPLQPVIMFNGTPLALQPGQKIPDGFVELLQKKEEGILTPEDENTLSQMQVAMGFDPLANITLSLPFAKEREPSQNQIGKVSVKAPDIPVIYTDSGAVLMSLFKEGSHEGESEHHKQQEGEMIVAPTTAPLPQMLAPTIHPSEPPSYTKLPQDFYELFEKMVGVMTVEMTKGVSTTTVKLDMPGSVFDKAEIILERYETAPNSFNLQLQGSEKAVNLFNANISELAAAFQGARLSFEVNIRRPILLKKEEEDVGHFHRKSTDYDEEDRS